MTTNGESPSEYVTLVSNDGFEFVVLREATFVSPAIKSMLDPRSRFIESTTGRCVFQDLNGTILAKVVLYFLYWYKNKDREEVADMEIPVEHCLELLLAGDFLGLWCDPHNRGMLKTMLTC